MPSGNGYVVLATLAVAAFVSVDTFSLSAMKKGRCSYIGKLSAYDCVGLDLPTIPDDLYSSTEILDVSLNRIRELTNSSFKNYAYLKKLYLNDNMIMTIEAGAFECLDNLDTLDLSMNALIEVPASIFHMPSLEKLMLAKNLRLDILGLIHRAVPVTAPLQYLDISFSPMLNQMPQFGVIMDLVHLNVTGNHVTNVSMANFIGLCNLKWFSNENLTMEFSSACDCAQINDWFDANDVQSIPEFTPRCEFAQDRCDEDLKPSALELATHEKCIADFQVRQTLKSVSQICYIVFGVIGGIILVVGVCYVYYRFQRFSDDDENKNVKKDIKSETANVHLLKLNNEYNKS